MSITAAKEVVYCKICTYPPEYCEFTGKIKSCKAWLEDAHPELYAQLYGAEDITDKLAASSIGAEKEEKLEQDLARLQRKTEARAERDMAKKLASKVLVQRIARTKKKHVIAVQGLEVFEIDMKKLAKTFASKFATSCSVAKNIEKKCDEVVIQGDFAEAVEEYIVGLLEEKGLSDIKVEIVSEKMKKKPTAAPAS